MEQDEDNSKKPDFIARTYELPNPSGIVKLKNIVFKTFIMRQYPLQVSLFWDKEIKKKIEEIIVKEQPDYVISDFIRTTEYLKDYKGFKIADLQDLLSLRYERQLKVDLKTINPYGAYLFRVPKILQKILQFSFVKKYVMRTEISLLKDFEMNVGKCYDRVMFVARREAERFDQMIGERKSLIAPLGVDYDFFSQDLALQKKEHSIAFMGALNVAHNENGILHFIENCMAERPQGLKNKIYYGVRLYLGKLFATDYFACGRDAGIYLFGKRAVDTGKVTILPNAVDYDKFKFNRERRQEIRKNENIDEDTIVVGHVGRYFEQKNHRFLIKIFNEFHKIRPNSELVLLGDGELMESIKQQVKEMELVDAVRFLGNRSDVDDWYQAMDVFVLPSLYEGFPVVGVEAQAAGLPCIFSEEITSEIQISPNAAFIELEAGARKWADKINEMLLHENARDNVILDYNQYDIRKNAATLDQFYKERASS